MKLSLTIIKFIIIYLHSLSAIADDFMVKVKLPTIASPGAIEELNDLANYIDTNILTNMITNKEAEKQHKLTIKCSMAPDITNVEYNIQKNNDSQLAIYNNNFPHISDNTEITSFTKHENSGSLGGCEIEHFPTIMSGKINNYLSRLMSSNKNTNNYHEASIFYAKVQIKKDNKVDVEYFAKKVNIGIN